MKPILCVDFDGVIHSYDSGWQGATVIPDPPTPGVLFWLAEAIDHFRVVVYSSRSKEEGAILAMRKWLQEWLEKRFNLEHPIIKRILAEVEFAHEKPVAFLTIDDRAICFQGDWTRLAPSELLKFKPWNKR